MPSQQTFGLYAVSPSGSCPVNGSIYGSATALYQCLSGTWTAVGGSSSLTIGTTPITSGSNGRLLYDDAGVLGEELSTALTFNANQITQGAATTGQVLAWNGSVWAPTSAGSGGLTIGTTPITGGTSGYVLEDVSGVLQNIATETADALPAAATPSGTDTVLAHQSGTSTVAMTLSNLASYVASTISGVVTEIIDGAGNIATGNVTFWGTHKSGLTIISGGLFDISNVPPALSEWTKFNVNGTTSVTQSAGGTITLKDTGANSITARGIMFPAPSSPPYLVAAFIQATQVGAVNCLEWGWSDGTKIHNYSVFGSGSAFVGGTEGWSDSNTRAYFSGGATVPLANIGGFFAGVEVDTSGNGYFVSSNDGVNFNRLYSFALSSGFLGSGGYTNIEFNIHNETNTSQFLTIRSYNPNELTASFP